MSENSPRRAMLAQTLPRIRTSMLSCPAVPRMRENHGRESGVERIVPCFGTSTGPIRPVQRDGRASQRVGPRSRVSGLSLSRRRHVLVTRMTSDERAIAGNRRPIFSPGRRERWVYGRTQNGCRQERSTVSEHEWASEKTSFLPFSVSHSFLLMPSLTHSTHSHTDTSACNTYITRGRAIFSLSLSAFIA